MNLALVVSGEPESLKHLDKTFKKVNTTLEEQSVFTSIALSLKGTDKLDEKIVQLGKDYNTIDSFLFYYIGHGKINHSNKISHFEFSITSKITKSLKDITLKIREHINPKKIFIVVDACNSGQIFDDLDSFELDNVYLLASCSSTELSYECDKLESTLFSAYFCESLTKAKESMTFETIKSYIIDKLKDDSKKQSVDSRDYCEIKDTLITSAVKKELPPEDKELYVTVELIPVDSSNFKILAWGVSENREYSNLDFADDDITYQKEEIAKAVDLFILEKYPNKTSDEITIIFVLPLNLMQEEIYILTLILNPHQI